MYHPPHPEPRPREVEKMKKEVAEIKAQCEGLKGEKDEAIAICEEAVGEFNANSEFKLIFFNGTRPLFSYPQSTDPYSVEG